MTASQQGRYSILRNDGILVFRTGHFTEGSESILHSDIFNREFASILSAGVVLTVLAIVLILNERERTLVAFIFSTEGAIVILVAFIGLFIIFRTAVFRERSLVAIFNRETGIAEILTPGLVGEKKAVLGLRDVRNILIETSRKVAENPDAVEFVEKISAQHGMVIPGFGEEKVLYSLKLMLADGTDRLIYADSRKDDAMAAHEEIKEFLEI